MQVNHWWTVLASHIFMRLSYLLALMIYEVGHSGECRSFVYAQSFIISRGYARQGIQQDPAKPI